LNPCLNPPPLGLNPLLLALTSGSGPGDDLRKLQPAEKNPFMLRLLLGKNISVITQRRADRYFTSNPEPSQRLWVHNIRDSTQVLISTNDQIK
jgi:hypothetical protein